MRKLFALALVGILAMSLTPVTAKSALGGFVTYWNADDFDNGFGIGGLYRFGLIPLIDLDARLSYVGFEDDASVVPLEAVGMAKLGMFYGGLSLGYYFWSVDDLSADDGVGGSVFGGIGFGILGIGAFAELRYNMAETKIEGHTAKGDGVSLNLGATFGL